MSDLIPQHLLTTVEEILMFTRNRLRARARLNPCSTCAYYADTGRLWHNSYIECRRYPPVPQPEGDSCYPEATGGGCGEWVGK